MFPIPQINPFLPEPPEIPPTVTPPQPPAPANDPLGNAPLNELLGPPPEQPQRPQLTPIAAPGWVVEGIKGFEGTRGENRPYWDVRQWTGMYGTKARGPNDRYGHDEAMRRLRAEADPAWDRISEKYPHLSDGWKGALTSLTYNAGPKWKTAGLGQAVERGDMDRARDLFVQYTSPDPRYQKGLRNRRLQELGWVENGPPASAQLPQGPQASSPAGGARAASELGSPSTAVGPGGEPRHKPQWAEQPSGGYGVAGAGGVDAELAAAMAYDQWLMDQQRQQRLQDAFSKLGSNIAGAMSQRPSNVGTSGMRTAANAKGLDADRFAANLKLGGGSQRPSELLAQLQRRALFA